MSPPVRIAKKNATTERNDFGRATIRNTEYLLKPHESTPAVGCPVCKWCFECFTVERAIGTCVIPVRTGTYGQKVYFANRCVTSDDTIVAT